MRKLFLILGLLVSSVAFCQSPPSLSPVGATVTYSSGSVPINGTNQSITGGTLTSFTASMNACSQTAINAGTDACEYIYATPGSSSLLHSTNLDTAMPWVIATVTTDASGNPLVVSGYAPVYQPSNFTFGNCGNTTVCSGQSGRKYQGWMGTPTFSGTTFVLTGLPFANANYRVLLGPAAHAITVTKNSASQCTFTGTSGDTFDYLIVGKVN